VQLEFHQLKLRYERLRVIRPEQERRLLASLAEVGQQVPIVVVKDPGHGRFVRRVACGIRQGLVFRTGVFFLPRYGEQPKATAKIAVIFFTGKVICIRSFEIFFTSPI